MKIDLPHDLAERLFRAARRLKRDPTECALSAITAFVTDCEESFALAAQFGDGIARPADDGFMD
jgi:hypothetical protein